MSLPMRFFNNRLFFRYLLLLCLSTFTRANGVAAEEIAIQNIIKGGNIVALMRHAIAPGNGDPVEFNLSDCNTQRNLSNDGRRQAKKIGLQFKQAGVAHADIYTSQWCRCVDTATHLDLGKVQALPFLNSFYQDRSTENIQTQQLTQWITSRLGTTTSDNNANKKSKFLAILVTHQVNITALTGVFPASGELVFVTMENDKLAVVANVNVPFQEQNVK